MKQQDLIKTTEELSQYMRDCINKGMSDIILLSFLDKLDELLERAKKEVK